MAEPRLRLRPRLAPGLALALDRLCPLAANGLARRAGIGARRTLATTVLAPMAPPSWPRAGTVGAAAAAVPDAPAVGAAPDLRRTATPAPLRKAAVPRAAPPATGGQDAQAKTAPGVTAPVPGHTTGPVPARTEVPDRTPDGPRTPGNLAVRGTAPAGTHAEASAITPPPARLPPARTGLGRALLSAAARRAQSSDAPTGLLARMIADSPGLMPRGAVRAGPCPATPAVGGPARQAADALRPARRADPVADTAAAAGPTGAQADGAAPMPRGGAGGDVDLLGMLEVLMPMPAHPLGARATAGPKDLADRGPQAAEQAAEQSVDAFAFDLRVRDSLGRIAAADLLRHGLDDPEEA